MDVMDAFVLLLTYSQFFKTVPVMSPEYEAAMSQAVLVMQELGPKIRPGGVLTPSEGQRMLNAHWDVYLCAVCEGDMSEADESLHFINLIVGFLELLGYTVEFSAVTKYCVKEN